MIGDRVRDIREFYGLNQGDFSKKLECSPKTLWNYETGKSRPDSDFLSKLIHIFNADPVWILSDGDTGTMFRDGTKPECNYEKEFVKVPLISAKASAGSGIENHNVKIMRDIPILKRLLAKYLDDLHRIKAAEISGNSMEPDYYDGDIALYLEGVDRRIDDVYVLNRNGELIVKQVQFDDPDLVLISINKTYPEKRIRADSQDNIRIIGRVIGKISMK